VHCCAVVATGESEKVTKRRFVLVKKAGASPLVPVLQKPSLGTGQPLSEIAYACGFRDYTHFARKFRQRFGYSPGAATRDMLALPTP
jgi:AraC-like DNA-binding protein